MNSNGTTAASLFSEPVAIGMAATDGFDEVGEKRYQRDVPRLTRALRTGDEAAFRVLHGGWNARLYRYSFALARGDGAFADEITQATYLRVLRHMRELPDEEALWSWLALAARHAASDLRRAGGRYVGALARFAAGLVGNNAEASATHEADTPLLAALDEAMRKLDDSERALLKARYFERVSLAGIAGRMGGSVRAVEGRLARARSRLRKLMERQLKEMDLA